MNLPFSALSAPFVILLFVTVTAATQVVTHRNIVHAAVYLGLTFLGVAGIYLLLNAPFLAGAQVLIYVGAITVLILFALMMTQQRLLRVSRSATAYNTMCLVVTGTLFAILWFVCTRTPWPVQEGPQADYLDQLAQSLLGVYLLPFEIASVLLLVALVGAIVLAKEEREA